MPHSTGFRELLALLGHGSRPGDHTIVSYRQLGDWYDEAVPSAEAPDFAAALDADVWFAVCPFPAGRRKASRALRLPALFADLDLGKLTPEAVEAILTKISKVLGAAPAVVVDSGGGRHPYWPLADPPSGDEAAVLLRRFGVLVQRVAAEQGGTADPVYDLARVLRVPGTTNTKYDPPRPVTATEDPDDLLGAALTVADVLSALTREGVQEAQDDDLAGYDGPAYEDLTPARQRQAREHTARLIDNWRDRLTEAAGWDATERDDKNRGWEALAYQFAWSLAREAVSPWAPPLDGAQLFADTLPEELAADPKCRGKWRHDILAKAADRPADPPPWVLWPDAAADFAEDLEPDEGDLFDATPTLAKIRTAARSRMVAPWTLLGYVLARVCVELPPTITLPPLIGGRASLNIAFGMVGGSGAGKSVTETTADDLMGGPLPAGWLLGPGSGEGLVESFLIEASEINPKTNQLRKVRKLDPDPHRLLYADEIRHLDKVQGRAGESMAPLLRTALTGGHLITTNASADRRRAVPKMCYRLVAVAGIQPDAADALFRYTSEGTPQRWVWLPTDDPGAPDVEPEWPGELGWDGGLFGDFGETEVVLPDTVVEEVRANRRTRLRTKVENVDGHWMITKEKVAVLLAALHGTLVVDDRFWALAGEVMAVSDRERDECLRLYRSAGEREAVARRRAETRADETVADEAVERAVKSALGHLQKNPGQWVAWSLLPKAARRPNLDREEVAEELGRQAGVEVEHGELSNGTEVIKVRYTS